MIYSEKNIEDWDFRTNCDPESDDYDVEADAFVDAHYVTVFAVDHLRLSLIEGLMTGGIAELDDDGRHVRITRMQPDAVLSGTRAAYSRFTRGDRFTRRVIQSMRREYKKYGCLRVTILPVNPDAAGEE